MLKTRADVQAELESIMGNDRVYFQPPESLKIKYPCIVYSMQTVDRIFADDGPWIQFPEYLVSYIGKDPDDPKIAQLMETRGLAFDRHYVSDNLHHNVFRYMIY